MLYVARSVTLYIQLRTVTFQLGFYYRSDGKYCFKMVEIFNNTAYCFCGSENSGNHILQRYNCVWMSFSVINRLRILNLGTS